MLQADQRLQRIELPPDVRGHISAKALLELGLVVVRDVVAGHGRDGEDGAKGENRKKKERRKDALSVSVRALAANGGEGDAAVLNAQALAAARRAVELDPDSAIALAALGSALAFTGQARDAVPYLERAIEIDPTHCPTVAVLALALVYRGRPDDAAICAERAVGLSRNDPVGGYISLFALAHAELLRNHDDAAETAIRRAISLNPAYVWSRVLLANLLGLQGDKTGALAAFADATQPFGSAKRLVEVYRTLHLPRFERSSDATRMAAGLKAIGVEI